MIAAVLAAAAALLASNETLTAIRGIRVGHHTLAERPTGCTVILVDGGAVAGVAQRGAAPGTRETDLLRGSTKSAASIDDVDRIDAVMLSGGSAYGLDAATGVMRWLDEHRAGRDTSGARVPIVASAVLIDLWVGGKPRIRPGGDCGYRAAAAAMTAPVREGTVGAGAGATVGKLSGRARAMKGGIGSAIIVLSNGLQVGAIVAVNPLGDVIDPQTGRVVAGVRSADGSLADARTLLRTGATMAPPAAGENTTIGVVATNARLTKADANRVAHMADSGYARAISPIHTLADGDTIFALATGRWTGDADAETIGALAADAMADAIVRAVTKATSAAGIPAARDLKR
jgi:L-aminopeptidase/D-esterase-like protein